MNEMTPSTPATRGVQRSVDSSAMVEAIESHATVRVRAALSVACTEREDTFAHEFVLCHNQAEAYRRAFDCSGLARTSIWVAASRVASLPHVQARIREYKSAVALAHAIDIGVIIEHDRAIVDAYAHIGDLMQHVWHCCRYCNGVDHKYQWVDADEYLTALLAATEANEERQARKQKHLPLPTDAGGYGFKASNEPHAACPQCEGRGTHVTIFADTTKLTGPAALLFKGIKETSNGKEILLHDIDKAKDRIYRITGQYGDDAASVARGAAAGAAAGAAIAAKAAERVATLDTTEAQRLYLELAGGVG